MCIFLAAPCKKSEKEGSLARGSVNEPFRQALHERRLRRWGAKMGSATCVLRRAGRRAQQERVFGVRSNRETASGHANGSSGEVAVVAGGMTTEIRSRGGRVSTIRKIKESR